MSASMPYTKWFARDWLGDPLLRLADLSERGLWADLLNVMMTCDPYGHLATAGRAMTDEDAARITGTDIGTYKATLKRLEDRGIPSRTDTGMIYSRRLVRDHALFLKASESGKKGGGNPRLRESNTEAIVQNPESRIQTRVSINPPIKAPIKGKDRPESIELVKSFAAEIGLPAAEADKFWDFYESKGWLVGKSPMKNWKAACRNWKRNAGTFGGPANHGNPTSAQPSKPATVWELTQKRDAIRGIIEATIAKFGLDFQEGRERCPSAWAKVKKHRDELKAIETQIAGVRE
jgi:hypothetical protein